MPLLCAGDEALVGAVAGFCTSELEVDARRGLGANRGSTTLTPGWGGGGCVMGLFDIPGKAHPRAASLQGRSLEGGAQRHGRSGGGGRWPTLRIASVLSRSLDKALLCVSLSAPPPPQCRTNGAIQHAPGGLACFPVRSAEQRWMPADMHGVIRRSISAPFYFSSRS